MNYDDKFMLEEATGYVFKWSIIGDELHAEMSLERVICWMGTGFNTESNGFFMGPDSD